MIIPKYVLTAAKEKWPEINDKTIIHLTTRATVIIPKFKDLPITELVNLTVIRAFMQIYSEEQWKEVSIFEEIRLEPVDLVSGWQAAFASNILVIKEVSGVGST